MPPILSKAHVVSHSFLFVADYTQALPMLDFIRRPDGESVGRSDELTDECPSLVPRRLLLGPARANPL